MTESELIRLTFDSIHAEAWAHHRTVLLRVGKAEGDVAARRTNVASSIGRPNTKIHSDNEKYKETSLTEYVVGLVHITA